jgi:hypothetical protein
VRGLLLSHVQGGSGDNPVRCSAANSGLDLPSRPHRYSGRNLPDYLQDYSVGYSQDYAGDCLQGDSPGHVPMARLLDSLRLFGMTEELDSCGPVTKGTSGRV